MSFSRDQINREMQHQQQFQEEHNETNISNPWYFSVVSNIILLAQEFKKAFVKFPSNMIPNNPANQTFLLGAWAKVLGWLSPVALGLLWVNTIYSFKKLRDAENRNFERYGDAILSLVTSAAWTSLYVIGIAATAVVATHVIPYLIAAVFGVNALYGFFGCIKHLYAAFKTDCKHARSQHLWDAAKQLLGVATNTLGFVVNLFLGIKASELGAVGENFSVACKAIYAAVSAACVGAAMNTMTFNQQTWELMKSPLQGLSHTWAELKESPFSIFSVILNIPLRIAALSLAPLQLIGVGVQKFFGLFNGGNREAQDSEAINISAIEKERKYQALVDRIRKKRLLLTAENSKNPSDIRAAKITLLDLILQRKLGAMDGAIIDPNNFNRGNAIIDIETDVKRMNPNVYQSFFRSVGETQELVNAVRHYETEFYPSPRPAP